MNHRLVVGLTAVCFLLLTGGLFAGAAVGLGPDGDGGGGFPLTTSEEFDATTFEFTLYGNGSVRWAIKESRPLRNETERAQFESFAEEFSGTETQAYENFRIRARQMVSDGSNVTGRDMEARAFQKDAYVDPYGQARGFVELSFVWTNMAQVEDDRVVLGDVFRGGMFVDQGQRLIVRHGPDVAFQEARPEPDSMAPEGLAESESVTWFGEREFAPQRPSVGVTSADGQTGGGGETDGTTGGTDDAAPADGDGQNGSGMMMALLVLAFVVAIGVAGGAAWYRGSLPGTGERGATAESPETAGPDAGAGSDPGDAGAAVPPSELISDEDRVLSLLEDNGGRMKQVKIVEETDWSKSKVSMLLSDMEEEGQISKLRVGRENIVSIAGQEPEAAGSPFDDE